jgi:hypothetical protein
MRLLTNLVIGMLTIANVLVIAVTVTNLFRGHRPEEDPGGNRPGTYMTQEAAMPEEMPAPARAYENAVNHGQPDSLERAFAECGVVDVSRRIPGRTTKLPVSEVCP